MVIAPERAKRPNDFVHAESLKPSPRAECVFCLSSVNYQKYRLKQFENEEIYVIPNKFPAFVEDKLYCSPRVKLIEDRFFRMKPALGGHDVIVIKEHELTIFEFSERIWRNLFQSIRDRYIYWRVDCNTEYAMAIYNQGQAAGASIYHPHAQLVASDVIPNMVRLEMDGSMKYFQENGRCVFCELINHERLHKTRLIYETDDFVAFTFYAARFPFEVWILPKKHISHFEKADRTFSALAKCIQHVVNHLGQALNKPPFNFYLHDLPSKIGESDYFHWHLEIALRLSTYGGYELGSGIVIDVMTPEDAAGYLKNHH